MLIRETIQKTKMFFHKNLQNLKSFLFGEYRKLPRSLSFNPFSCRNAHQRTFSIDNFYNDLYDEWESDLHCMKKTNNDGILTSKEPAIEDYSCKRSFMNLSKESPVKEKHEGGGKARNKGSTQLGKAEDLCQHKKNGGDDLLEQKIKDLEMMDARDVEQVLDIEEALHYYSRLKSPVYQDIVNKFFMDMHSEFSVPQTSVTINNSKRTLGSIRL
ncbi:putative ATP-dependent RNA helicase DDX11-like protein [Quillaja saponaria]|uniref:ATP-dependent RNA helicase DDX11-like protein n=1 Tax=Quillaja saponaria TaxID=32244 RepID=A0AAD7L5M9_QUISA|nr:putative ATP-dependent RNA helicase DDX11-like protein [Quillaja saponaria]